MASKKRCSVHDCAIKEGHCRECDDELQIAQWIKTLYVGGTA